MTTPMSAEAEAEGQRPSSRDVGVGEIAVWRLIECLAGGGAAAAVFLFALPVLADLASPLRALSPTGLLFAFLFVWLFFWTATAAARERAIGYPLTRRRRRE
ncbi:hypothetical protein [Halorubrum laminariae]|uniref:Uncharacterized protein n=1 Tax=Halorubrum laminariae TaxID=1433523 RepID=A0ABD6BZB6_9EURY|nr:hypothetical protein [Halorubrum laminariae]